MEQRSFDVGRDGSMMRRISKYVLLVYDDLSKNNDYGRFDAECLTYSWR